MRRAALAKRRKAHAADHESTRPQVRQGCEDRIEVTFGPGIEDMELHPDRACRRLHVGRLTFSRICRVDKQRHEVRLWQQFVQQFQALRRHLNV